MARSPKAAHDESRSRSERKEVKSPHYLQSKTIGTSMSFLMQILDVSHTGMKLRWDSGQKMPFLENTLIEVSVPIRLGKGLPEQTIQSLAKVVRTEESGEKPQEFGIKMIFLEPHSHQLWKEAVSYLH